MEYPVLHWHFWGGGLPIALVATIHVFIAHFAVGGGLFIAVMETRTQRLGLTGLRDYLRRYARFFLLLTMVVGAITGVGIWFSISIGAPGATSALIHAFVLGWATEWTFFLAEIVTLPTYMRSFEAQQSRRRLILAWLYFAFAWASLAVVQGFISFMLTPGEWTATGRFWDGFFNPTYFPGLVFRTAIAAVTAVMEARGTPDDLMDRHNNAIGAAIGTLAVITRQELLLVVMGGIFVIETLSVMVQVASYKLTGKRVFRMAPIHHHFELKGWPEPRVIVRFWIISVVLVLASLATIKVR